MNDDNIGAAVDSSKSNGNGPGNKDNKRLKFQHAGTTYYVKILVESYGDGNLAILLTCKDDELNNEVPFAILTVNLPLVLEKWYSFIDTNNLSDGVLKWLADNKLAIPTGKYQRGGYCIYPLYCFDPEVLQKHDPDGCAKYSQRFDELWSEFLE